MTVEAPHDDIPQDELPKEEIQLDDMPTEASLNLPILYSFRRCPYAMRARLAIQASGQLVELREIVLREKAPQMLNVSPKGTVPVLALQDGSVIEESIDIINWALSVNDGENWLNFSDDDLKKMSSLIEEADGPFKACLDRYKYENRFDDVVAKEQRDLATDFLFKLNLELEGQDFLFGNSFSKADGAILPFIRQYAHVDKEWFWQQEWPHLIKWLDAFLESNRFASIMDKYPKWEEGDEATYFGGQITEV